MADNDDNKKDDTAAADAPEVEVQQDPSPPEEAAEEGVVATTKEEAAAEETDALVDKKNAAGDDDDVEVNKEATGDAAAAAAACNSPPGNEATIGGCRECCSIPHGKYGLTASIVATFAFALAIAAVNDCHFLSSHYLYCHPPPEKKSPYGMCGDCHCIYDVFNKSQSCPSDPNKIPLTDMSDDWLRQLKRLKVTNPIQMRCNPYKVTNGTSCTDPPQDPGQVELWETAVCAHMYNMSSLDEDSCPTEYNMTTFNSKEEMLAAGAEMSHWGACGACSTAQDLTVYVEYPDLTAKGQECAVRSLANVTDGIVCFEEVGYTPACAEAWMYNVMNTREHCFDICFDFTFFSEGLNNGPPPECKISNCLLCDEQMSGPVFQTDAARSRRRSGLLSRIVRDCDNLLIVDHKPPCNVTREAVAQGTRYRTLQSSEKPVAPEKFRPPEPTETCVFLKEDLGLGGYATREDQNWLPTWLLSSEEQTYTSLYNSCTRYNFRSVVSGFWSLQRDIFGPSYKAARAFGILAAIIGAICVVFLWVSSCFAFEHVFWKWMAGLLAMCGVFDLLTLVFLNSQVCMYGCTIGQSAIIAIIAGILYFIAAIFCFMTRPFDPSLPRTKTCCLPEVAGDTGAMPSAYKPVSTSDDMDRTDISVTETVQSDGTTVIEKVTTYPGGSKSIEVTTMKKAS